MAAAILLREPPVDGRIGFPVLAIDLGGPSAADVAAAASRVLQDGDPAVYVSELWLDQGQLAVIASTLSDEEAQVVVDAIVKAVADGRAGRDRRRGRRTLSIRAPDAERRYSSTRRISICFAPSMSIRSNRPRRTGSGRR